MKLKELTLLIENLQGKLAIIKESYVIANNNGLTTNTNDLNYTLTSSASRKSAIENKSIQELDLVDEIRSILNQFLGRLIKVRNDSSILNTAIQYADFKSSLNHITLGEVQDRKLNYENYIEILYDNLRDSEYLNFLTYIVDEENKNKNKDRIINYLVLLKGGVSTLLERLVDYIRVQEPLISYLSEENKKIDILIQQNKNIERSLVEYIDQKKDEIDRYFNSLKNEIDSLSNRISSSEKELDRVSKSSLKFDENISKNKNKLEIFNSKFEDVNAEYSIYKTELNEKVQQLIFESEKNNKEIFYNRLDVFNKELDGVDIEIKKQIDLIQLETASIQKTSKNFKDFITEETSIKLTNDYKSKARWEKVSYYLFSIASFVIIFFALKLSWDSLTSFSDMHSDGKYTSLDLTYLAIRLIFSVIIFSSIALTSRIASKAYNSWKKNEGIYLRLTALKPFIAEMSKDKQIEIHEKLIDVYFGKEEHNQSYNEKLRDLPNNITQLLGKVVEQTGAVLDVKNNTSNKENENGESDKPK